MELGPSESLVGVEQMVSSPGNTFVHSYLQSVFDGHMDSSLKTKKKWGRSRFFPNHVSAEIKGPRHLF